MSGVVTESAAAERALEGTWPISPAGVWARAAEFVEISKPRIAVMVLVAVTVGYGLGCEDNWRIEPWLHAMIGVALAATSASAFNQLLERRTDALMRRTANRALPTGRLAPRDVLWFGLATAAIAICDLALFTNLTTVLLTIASIALYSLAYTLLKPRSALCTAVGAVPGALPVLLGWTAAGASPTGAGLTLFAIMFLWQFPHFLAIAWKYREQYAAAGLRMLPAGGSRVVGAMAATYALVLIPVSLLPCEQGLAGDVYGVTALVLGLWYAAAALRFAWRGTDASARRLLWVSLVYLPVLLGVLLTDHWRLLQ
jgi:protoheme IX farnesyltransferase